MIKIIGLGPGRAGLITQETWTMLNEIEVTGISLYLRTKIHPTVEELEQAGIHYQSYDSFYDKAANFEELYEAIVSDLLGKAKNNDIIYAVPGSPLVAEKTVALLTARAKTAGIAVTIYPAMSFLEPLFTELGIDPINGITILDATDEEAFNNIPNTGLIITQMYSREVASNLKLALMEKYPDEQELIFLHNLALEDESIRKIKLYELDRQVDIDHLTTIYIPKTA